MKKWLVECMVDDREQFAGIKPHDEIYHDVLSDFVEAESPKEAIEYAIDRIIEDAINNGCTSERYEETVVIYDRNGEKVEYNYNFRAKEMLNNGNIKI